MSGHARNDRTWTIGLTFRPHGGARAHHLALLRRYLDDYADQWEFYEEEAEYGNADTRHFHGRILFKKERRMDKVREFTARRLRGWQDSKAAVKVSYLYDRWEYSSKDGNLVEEKITDEDRWVYADERDKFEKRKNAQIHYYLSLMDLPMSANITRDHLDTIVWRECIRLWCTDKIEMPGTQATQKNIVDKIVLYHYYHIKNQVSTDDLLGCESDSD